MVGPLRWLYHALLREDWSAAEGKGQLAPESLAREGFVHASYRDRVVESARLYLPKDRAIVVLQIDPRLLDASIDVAETPRGPMPHVHGAIPIRAVTRAWDLEAFEGAPDYV